MSCQKTVSFSAEITDENEIKSYELEPSVIEANLFPYQNGESINQEQLLSIPAGNGDITSILKMLPNVQFDNKRRHLYPNNEY